MDGIASQGPLARSYQIDAHIVILVTKDKDTVEHTMRVGCPAICQTTTKESFTERCISQDMATVTLAQKVSGFATVVVFMFITFNVTMGPAIIDIVEWLINGT